MGLLFMSSFSWLNKGARAAVAGISFFVATACSGEQQSEPELFLIPEGYVGSFYIVFNIPSGEPQTYEDGARVYDIPEDGVLVMQSDSNPGTISSDKENFFYESDDGSRTKVGGGWTSDLKDTPEHRSDDQTYIFGGGIGGIEPVRHCQVYIRDFYVGTKAQVLDNVNYFDIYSDKGIGDMPSEMFQEACNDEQS